MSTSTLQKIHTANAATKVTYDQSQKLIQTMLTMSFGCVAFLRGLFPDDSFIDQRFVPAKFEKEYKPEDPKHKADSLRVKTLIRGKSIQVDNFLDWIEEGCVDAIKKKYLKSLTFGIFLDKSMPYDLYEVYTFHFNYADSSISIDISNSKSGGTEITLLNSRKMMQGLMKRFIIITQSLDPLPEEKFMTMRLLFNENCPVDYQPPYFMDASSQPAARIKTKIGSSEKYSVGALNTGHHGVQLSVISTSKDIEEHGPYDEIDPFDAPSERLPLPHTIGKGKSLKINDLINQPSQTTTGLRKFLESSLENTQQTQIITTNPVNCECQSQKEIEGLHLLICKVCSKKVHMDCYGEKFGQSIVCYSCRSKALANLGLHSLLPILLNCRKFFKIFKELPVVPQSITHLSQLMGFEGIEDVVVDTISLLISRSVIIMSEAPLKARNGNTRIGSFAILVETSGIVDVNEKELIPGNIYGFTIISKLAASKSDSFRSERAKALSFKTYLFEDTMNKFLSIDEILSQLSNTKIVEEEDIIDSSAFSSPSKVDVEDHFSRMNITSSRYSTVPEIDKPPLQSSQTKRKIENTYTSYDNVKEEVYKTSQPVRTSPRLKKRKTSVSKNVIKT
ncbi:hypothetical protein WICMUC_003548 [Wickerhamomyces mucosus]|uniref:HORMA domain-containing protein n=1 Tax=Wickerhamomyces mucosus TaxID=1378264 RepID=A0A9P8PL96_9ASCO|nr:hypothetical protein WICMUC_003548 [Wickerhamomyces mucosus]